MVYIFYSISMVVLNFMFSDNEFVHRSLWHKLGYIVTLSIVSVIIAQMAMFTGVKCICS